jgi:septal ring factor EnvC (AmiA/AmiB activator)
MKKYAAAAMMVLVSLTACDNKKERDELAKQYQSRYDSLHSIVSLRDEALDDFMASFAEIEKNLDSVTARQNIINSATKGKKGEVLSEAKERINSQILAINDLMEQNKSEILKLNKKVKKYSAQVAKFQKVIDMLNQEIAHKNDELAALNEKLASMHNEIAQLNVNRDSLTMANAAQTKRINEQVATIHTAYYVVGRSKELVEKKVIDKSGGVLGLGKTPKLSSGFDKDKFTQIDYTQVTTIPLSGKKAKVVTVHPNDSYTWDKEKDQFTALKITDPEKFWSASKYLVVVHN